MSDTELEKSSLEESCSYLQERCGELEDYCSKLKVYCKRLEEVIDHHKERLQNAYVWVTTHPRVSDEPAYALDYALHLMETMKMDLQADYNALHRPIPPAYLEDIGD